MPRLQSLSRPHSLPPAKAYDRFHVVLVEPGDSLNIGAVARAMMNLGYRHLHLVAPPRYEPARAAVTACWATDILEGAAVHDSLEAALAPSARLPFRFENEGTKIIHVGDEW